MKDTNCYICGERGTLGHILSGCHISVTMSVVAWQGAVGGSRCSKTKKEVEHIEARANFYPFCETRSNGTKQRNKFRVIAKIRKMIIKERILFSWKISLQHRSAQTLCCSVMTQWGSWYSLGKREWKNVTSWWETICRPASTEVQCVKCVGIWNPRAQIFGDYVFRVSVE